MSRTLATVGDRPAASRIKLPRAISSQLTLAIVFIMMIAVVPLAFFALWAVQEVDDSASVRERLLVHRGLAEAAEGIVREQRSVAEWDDAVAMTRARDQTWLDDNLGVWMFDFYGHDMAVVLDESGGFHREAQRFKQTGFRRSCQAPTGTPRPGIGRRGICAG